MATVTGKFSERERERESWKGEKQQYRKICYVSEIVLISCFPLFSINKVMGMQKGMVPIANWGCNLQKPITCEELDLQFNSHEIFV